MKRKRFSEEQIIEILRLHSAGASRPAPLHHQSRVQRKNRLNLPTCEKRGAGHGSSHHPFAAQPSAHPPGLLFDAEK